MSAGPFEFPTAVSFSFEHMLTHPLFMAGAAFNGDMATMMFGFFPRNRMNRAILSN
jgi:phenol hydroxylase P3 protein